MVDDRFSADRFRSLGLDTEEAAELARSLESELQVELHKVVLARVTELVDRLNELGHHLKPEYPPVPGDISFRDDAWEDGRYVCRLRVGADTVVSTGYGHLLTAEQVRDRV